MVPQILSVTGSFFSSFWTIFCLFTPVTTQNIKISKKIKKLTPGDIIILHMYTINQNHMMYGSWDIKHDRQNFFHFKQFFAQLPPKNPKNQNFEKMKKSPRDIIIQKCSKNYDHMLYCSWDMAHDGCNCYFSFWTIFCPFIPLTNGKIKIWKKLLEMSSFYTSLPKIVIIWYTVPEIWRMVDVIVIFHFGLFFAFLPPLTAQKIKFQKNENNKADRKRDT